MQRFTQLYIELDRTTSAQEKLSSLKRYFVEVAAEDAAWALFFLSGQHLPRSVKSTDLRQWVADERSLPPWLVEESYDAVGDLAETLALLASAPKEPLDLPLHVIVNERILPLKQCSEEEKHALVTRFWQEFSAEQCLVYHKLLLGEFRVSVSRALLVEALAEIAGVERSEMAHRIAGSWQPAAVDFTHIVRKHSTGISSPYPFLLASPVEPSRMQSLPEQLGAIQDWQAEWMWDGIRVQLIKRDDQVLLWSRSEELVTDRFPEIAECAKHLPNGTVIDGEVLAWKVEKPMPFAQLQRRVGRKNVDKKIRTEVPVVLMLCDLLEHRGNDIRSKSFVDRRGLLEHMLDKINEPLSFILSPLVEVSSWEGLANERASSRDRRTKGIILKRKSSVYGAGRTSGDWWKWKSDPLTVDVVLIYAQQESGGKTSPFIEYTFGVWGDPDESGERQLIPVAKTNLGLTEDEVVKIDRFVRENTLDKFGPVRVVKPELVFELTIDGIQRSTRHKAGLVVRFPRISRWHEGRSIEQVDSLEMMHSLLKSIEV